MTSERVVKYIWTCDRCGSIEAVDASGSGRPRGWSGVVCASLVAQFGNLPPRHLCVKCSTLFREFMASGKEEGS